LDASGASSKQKSAVAAQMLLSVYDVELGRWVALYPKVSGGALGVLSCVMPGGLRGRRFWCLCRSQEAQLLCHMHRRSCCVLCTGAGAVSYVQVQLLCQIEETQLMHSEWASECVAFACCRAWP